MSKGKDVSVNLLRLKGMGRLSSLYASILSLMELSSSLGDLLNIFLSLSFIFMMVSTLPWACEHVVLK